MSFAERKIIIGLITNKEYLKKIQPVLKLNLLSAPAAKISKWCVDYYNKYEVAPNREIEAIYMQKLKTLQKEDAEFIQTLLDGLSNEYEETFQKDFNTQYLIDETVSYMKAQQLIELSDQVLDEVEDDNLQEAENLFTHYKPIEISKSKVVPILDTVQQCKDAFSSFSDPLISYGKTTALGQMIDRSMGRGCLVGFLGQSKVGKSFFLMELAIKAATAGHNVVFFQAGDMTHAQMERRMAIYYAKKSDLPEYCNRLYIPRVDCLYNLTGDCRFSELQENKQQEPPLSGYTKKDFRNGKSPIITSEVLFETFQDYPDHDTCINCAKQGKYFTGAVWYTKKNPCTPLTWKSTYQLFKKEKYRRILDKIHLITYPNESLTMQQIRIDLDLLKEEKGVIPAEVLIDYADILAPDPDTMRMPVRDQENKKWQRARKLSQELDCLVVMPTQSDATGFDVYELGKNNFSEDRRKFDHCTSFYGLNQTPDEKRMGVFRINDIANREGAGGRSVRVLQRLEIGRPHLGSFF